MCTDYSYTAVSKLREGTFKDDMEATTLVTRMTLFIMGWLYSFFHLFLGYFY